MISGSICDQCKYQFSFSQLLMPWLTLGNKHAGQLSAGGVFDGCGMFGWCRIWFVCFNMFSWCTKRGLYIHNFIHIPSMIFHDLLKQIHQWHPRCQRSWRSSLRSKEVTLKGRIVYKRDAPLFWDVEFVWNISGYFWKIGWILGKRQILDDHGWVA